jgi:hypothetical protein
VTLDTTISAVLIHSVRGSGMGSQYGGWEDRA